MVAGEHESFPWPLEGLLGQLSVSPRPSSPRRRGAGSRMSDRTRRRRDPIVGWRIRQWLGPSSRVRWPLSIPIPSATNSPRVVGRAITAIRLWGIFIVEEKWLTVGFSDSSKLSCVTIISLLLAIRQSMYVQHDLQHWSLSTFPKEENLRNKRKPTRQVYLPSAPTFGLSSSCWWSHLSLVCDPFRIYDRGSTFPLFCFWKTGFLNPQIVGMPILISKKKDVL